MTAAWRETEFKLAEYLRENGFPHAEAVGSGAPGTDTKGTPGISWEAKRRKGFDVMAALRQNLARDADFHPVVMRPHGMGPKSIEQWPAIVPLSEFVRLLRLAGYGDPLEGAQSPPRRRTDASADQRLVELLEEVLDGLRAQEV